MKLRIYLLSSGLFLLGVVCGILLSIGIAKKQIQSITGRSTPEMSSLVVKFLDRRLRLSPEQEIAVKAVIEKSEDDVLPMRRELRTRFLEIIQTYQPQVASHLDGNQQKELQSIVDKLLQTWQIEEDPDAISN